MALNRFLGELEIVRKPTHLLKILFTNKSVKMFRNVSCLGPTQNGAHTSLLPRNAPG